MGKTSVNYLERAKSWLSDDFDMETRDQVQILINENTKELEDAFYRNLEFGTGGLRGIMGAGTNRINKYTIGMATQGLANYLKRSFPHNNELSVAISYDNRNLSSYFAGITADVFAANGFDVFLFDSLRPTPELSFTIRHFGCVAGVMITASHNPKEYNGYKAYWEDGAQVTAPHDANIIKEVLKIDNPSKVLFNGDSMRIKKIGKDVDLVMATEPDSDRNGIAVKDSSGNFILLNGNQMASILTYYLLERRVELGMINRGSNPEYYMVKTIVTSDLLKSISESYGVQMFDVLTGFKFIAEVVRELEGERVFIGGGEESYGFNVGEFVRDKDAVISCCLVAEAAVWARDKGMSLYDLLLSIYIKFGLYKEHLVSVTKKGKDGVEQIAKMMKSFRETPPQSLAGSPVVLIHDYLSSESIDMLSDLRYRINLPKSDVLQFVSSDNTIVSVRPSGTEPKIKFYFGVKTEIASVDEYLMAEEKLVAQIDKLVEQIKSY